jgi:hypothetical protein
MSLSVDPANELTWIFAPAKSQANNTGFFLADLTNFQTQVGVALNIGTKTIGDSDGAITLRLMTSATNNISNATNYTPGVGAATVATTNNTLASGVLLINTRDASRYAFIGVVVAGTNSPAYPIGVSACGPKKTEPT